MYNETRSDTSPKRNEHTIESNTVANMILKSCRVHDPSAHISSVLRDDDGRTIVRVRGNNNNNASVLLNALKSLWPLAKCSVLMNALDGTLEAEIIIPQKRDEFRRAVHKAEKSNLSKILNVLARMFALFALLMYMRDCYCSFANRLKNEFHADTSSSEELKTEL